MRLLLFIFLTSVMMSTLQGQSFKAEMFPAISPDGKKIAFLMTNNHPKRYLQLYVCNQDGSDLKKISPGDYPAFRASWFPTSKKLLYSINTGKGYQLAISNDDGSGYTLITEESPFEQNVASLSPDGKYVAYESVRNKNRDIFVMNLETKEEKRVISSDSSDNAPAWSPDGKKLAFHSKRNGNSDIYISDADGSNVIQITSNTHNDADPQWSKDGKYLSFSTNRDGNGEIYLIDLQTKKESNFSNHPKLDYWGTWMPDKRKILFHSSRDGSMQLYTANIDGTNVQKVLVE